MILGMGTENWDTNDLEAVPASKRRGTGRGTGRGRAGAPLGRHPLPLMWVLLAQVAQVAQVALGYTAVLVCAYFQCVLL